MAAGGARRRRSPRPHRSQAAARVAGALDRSAARRGLNRERERRWSAGQPSTAVMTIEEFGRRLRAHELTAEQMTDACLERIEADNPRLNAVLLGMADHARAPPRQADRELAAGRDRGPLHGVPISLKDLIDVRGTPTTAAS